MSTVTQAAKLAKQPIGGFIRKNDFEIINFKDEFILNKKENVHPSVVGLATDYLTRLLLGEKIYNAFSISLRGALNKNQATLAIHYLNNIKGLDDDSIIYASKLVAYDVFYRNPLFIDNPVSRKKPNKKTIENIRILVNRNLQFFKKFGPVLRCGFEFPGAYTNKIMKGDADYLTNDTIWDLKVSIHSPTSQNRLQLLIYYLLAKHSTDKIFRDVSKIGIFNPRINTAYLLDINNIDSNIIKNVEQNIIGYDNNYFNERLKNENIVTFNVDNECYTLKEVRQITNIPQYRLKQLEQDGLKLFKKENKYYIKKIDLYEWIEMNYRKNAKSRLLFAIIFPIYLLLIPTICLIIQFLI